MSMTKRIYLLLFLLSGYYGIAQQTYVPDDNFEHYLETHDAAGNTVAVGDANSMGNGVDNDDYVTTSKINTVTSLSVLSKGIYNLTGIADFTSLQNLNCMLNHISQLDLTQNTQLTNLTCSYNEIVSLNLSNNLQLTDLICNNNQLTDLDVSALNNLQTLNCSTNQLTSLDVSALSSLQNLSCHHNQLTDLDVSALSNLQRLDCNDNQLTALNMQNGNNTQITDFDATNNPDLTCIFVDDATWSENNWNNIDNTSHFVENQTQCDQYRLTNIPDNNFEHYLETHDATGNTVAVGNANSMGNGIDNDEMVPTSKIETITTLNIAGLSISDLTGIEDFTALNNLYCNDNLLSQIDISQNTNLKYLSCYNNQLTQLNVSQNTNLEKLYCSDNQLTVLDISQNTNLTYLNCYNNQLTQLDVSQNTNLETLECNTNQINQIDLSNNPNLVRLVISHNQLSNIDISNNTVLTDLICSNNTITNLNLTANTDLERIYCDYNQINQINLNNNTNLLTLDISNNQLANIDVSNNTILTTLKCDHNAITDLDLVTNTYLESLYCNNNNLSNLDVRNGTNVNNLLFFDATNNPNLSCIFVDDVNWSNSHWSLDPTAHFVENQTQCDYYHQTTDVPDDNFENYLETHDIYGQSVSLGDNNSMGNGIANDHKVLTYKINPVLELQISNLNISDLTGIADFTDLEILNCSNNLLTQLDISNNQSLQKLEINNNQIASIDVSQCPNLKELYIQNNQIDNINLQNNSHLEKINVSNNQLTSLNISTNTLLIETYCENNQINSLDITQNSQLQKFYCNNNVLTTLNIGTNTNLQELFCQNNQLIDIDVSGLNSLMFFNCDYNQLTGLNLQNGNNQNMFTFIATHNPDLVCVYVDDANWSNNNWGGSSSIDPTAHFVENQSQCDYFYQTTNVPDDNFENYLETHNNLGQQVPFGDANSLGNGIANDHKVLTFKINEVGGLDISNLSIQDVTGIEDFINLTNLGCANNQINVLDLTQNTLLTNLTCNNNNLTQLNLPVTNTITAIYCFDNQLTTLNLNNLTNLTNLDCANNNLTTIDVSQSTNLQELYCSNNQLTELNLQNGNNTNMSGFYATDNPNLTCIFVDDATWSNNNWSSNIDASAHFVETQAECDAFNTDTTIPDDNFEHYLETHDNNGNIVPIGDSNSLGNGIDNDDLVPTAKIAALSGLDISNLSIADISGIEDFSNLQYFNCANNQIATLNLSQNTALIDLSCNNNNLTQIDLPATLSLTAIYCFENQLTSLNVLQNTALITLDCSTNNINTLDISQNTSLTEFYCGSNQLTELNMQNGNNTQITGFDATNNPNLTCIFVDDATWSSNNWSSNIDASAHFVETQAECDAYQNTLTTNVTGNGNINLNPAGGNYSNGTVVTLTATPDNGWQFDYWTGDLSGNTNPAQITMDADKTVTAVFTQIQYNLTVNTQGNGSFSINPSGGTYPSGSVVTITATPDQGWQFDHWTGDLSGNTNPAQITMDANKTVTAVFTQIQQTYAPDDNFEQALIDLGYDTAPLDDYVPTANIENLTSLDVSSKNIADLTGIEDFAALQTLNCSINQLTNLDVSALSNLEELYCSNNQLTELNMQNGNNTQITDFDATNNPDLICIFVDDATWSNNNWSNNIDATAHFVETQAECDALSNGEIELNNDINIYPNPANDTIFIVNPPDSILLEIKIFDVTGSLIKEIDTNKNQYMVKDLPEGLYFIKIITNKGSITKKLIKS